MVHNGFIRKAGERKGMGSTKRTANIQYTGDQIVITSPYDVDFVSELKSGLKSRRWNSEKKCWIVDTKERHKLLEIARRFYQVVEDNQPTETPVSPSQYDAVPAEAPSGTKIDSVLRPGIELEIWTDGACVVNPGPGGYGIVFEYQGQKWEKAGGFRLTTNNRMEIMGALVALETIPEKCKATIYTDSQYLANSVAKGWARRWKSKGWIKKGNIKVPNADLWERMLQLCAQREVEFKWIKGHNISVENERCDQLAESAARNPDLPADEGYISTDGDS
jgi:ribonuclease HI